MCDLALIYFRASAVSQRHWTSPSQLQTAVGTWLQEFGGIVITEYPAFRFYLYFKLRLHILKILHYGSSKLVWIPQELANFKTIHFLFLSFIKDCMQISRLFEALPHGKYKNMRRKSNTTQFTRLLVITAINKCEFGRGKKSIRQLSHWFLSKKVTLHVIYAIINTAFFLLLLLFIFFKRQGFISI